MSIYKESWSRVADERKTRELALRSMRGDVPSFMNLLREYRRGLVPESTAREVITSLIPHNSEISRAVLMDDSALDIVLRYLGGDVEDFDPEILEWLPSEVNNSTPVSYLKWLTHQDVDFITDQIPGWEGEYFGDGKWGPGLYDHVLAAAYKSMDLELLRWVWDEDTIYDFKVGDFPEVSKAQVLVTPVEVLPKVSLQYVYYNNIVSVSPGNEVVDYYESFNEDGGEDECTLHELPARIENFSWQSRGDEWTLISGEALAEDYADLPSDPGGGENRIGDLQQTEIKIKGSRELQEFVRHVFR